MKNLKDKYKFEHIEAGHTPDGYSIYERIQLEDKSSRDHVEIHKGGDTAYFVNGNEHTHNKEAYQDMGIDTDSKEFKDFESGLKKDENYNTKYIEDFLKNAPELTAEKRQEIDKQRFEDLQKQIAADKEYQANGGFLAEMNEANNMSDRELPLRYKNVNPNKDFESELGIMWDHDTSIEEAKIALKEQVIKQEREQGIDVEQARNELGINNKNFEFSQEIDNEIKSLSEMEGTTPEVRKAMISEFSNHLDNREEITSEQDLKEAVDQSLENYYQNSVEYMKNNYDLDDDLSKSIVDAHHEKGLDVAANYDNSITEQVKGSQLEGNNWNTQTIKDEYGIKSDYEAGLLAEGYKDREDFENELTSHQNEFSEHDIKREDAVKTLTQWAVDHDQTKDIDQKVWDQNAMDTGYRDPEDTYYPDLETSNHVQKKFDELSQEGKTEIAKPGRTYSGNVIEVGEDTTIQKTKSGKFIIHETENLPGIKEEDSGSAARIIYDAGGKGDITAKSNDKSIEKEKEAEKSKTYEKDREIPF